MIGMKSHDTKPEGDSSLDVAKVLFDTFSKRVAAVETTMRDLNSELGMVKLTTERSQVSDLVLLERIQRAEGLLEESLGWTRRLIELIVEGQVVGRPSIGSQPESLARDAPVPVQTMTVGPIISPSGEAGTLSSITTPTELQVLTLIAERGAISAPEIGRLIGRSREHTARLMKRLYEEGYVRRDQNRIPFRYSLAERVRQSFSKQSPDLAKEASVESGTKEEAAAPPQS